MFQIGRANDCAHLVLPSNDIKPHAVRLDLKLLTPPDLRLAAAKFLVRRSESAVDNSYFPCNKYALKIGEFHFYTQPIDASHCCPTPVNTSIAGQHRKLRTLFDPFVARTSPTSYACRRAQGRVGQSRKNRSPNFDLRLPWFLSSRWRARGARSPGRTGGFCRATPCS